MNKFILGIDTSNYRTSCAFLACDGSFWKSCGRYLEVPENSLGLRQSEALFQHVRQLPAVLKELAADLRDYEIAAVACSDRPRDAEGSYMPCFLAGKSLGEGLGELYKTPVYNFSHQHGHIAAAAFSADVELLERPLLAWHLSGGTTELVLAEPDPECEFRVTVLGGTEDISAGQLIDRAGVALGMPFPAGAHVEAAAGGTEGTEAFRVKIRGYDFSLSGMENKFLAMIEDGRPREDICAFVLRTVADAVLRVTKKARKEYPFPVLFSGGVAANSVLRRAFQNENDVFFAEKALCGDNALGAAVLASRSLRRKQK